MKLVTCAGHEGYKCKNKISAYKSRVRRCHSCAAHAKREYDVSPERREQRRKYRHTTRGRTVCREGWWRRNGILVGPEEPLTMKRFKKDAKKGCRLKGFGVCYGNLVADHDHLTGRYRGPLCMCHNHVLGKLGDTSENLRRVANILDFPKWA